MTAEHPVDPHDPTEQLVLELRPHWWFFTHQLGWGALALAAAVLLTGAGMLAPAVVGAVWLAAVSLMAGTALAVYASWSHTRFVVTTRKVAYRSGVITRHGVEIPLTQLSNIVFHQTVLERLLKAGTLELESAGRDGESRFAHVADPEGVQRVLYRLLDALDTPTPIPSVPVAWNGPRPVDEAMERRLRELAALRAEGILDAAEHEAARRRILFEG